MPVTLLDAACRVCAESPPGAFPRWLRGTHCRHCHSSWSGRSAAHAHCCHRTFSSNSAADAHLVRGHCTDPATLEGFQLLERSDGERYWTPTTGVESQGLTVCTARSDCPALRDHKPGCFAEIAAMTGDDR
jgi:hypothetical protein